MTINRNLSKLAEGANSSGVLAVTNGGTGITSLTAGYIPYGNGTSAFSSSSNLYFDGTNLGLGVTPSAWSLSGGAALQTTGGAISSYSTINLTTAQNTYFNGTNWIYKNTAPASYYQQYNGTHAWNIAASGTAGNAITFTQAMTLDASGNLNVTSPASTDSLITINSTSTNVSQKLSFTANGTLQAQLYNDSTQTILNSVTSIPLVFKTANTERMRINSSGDVGIGTSSPTNKLHVNSGATGTALVLESSSTYAGLNLKNSSNSGSSYIGANGTAITFDNAGSEVMRISSAGNVGINATNPSFKLQVAVAAGGNGFNVTDTSSSDFVVKPGISTGLARVGPSAGAMALYTADTEKARLSSAGGFSVGTTADPGAGAIYATGNITAYYSSDRTLKENIQDVPNALSIVSAIGSKTFDWTDAYIASKGGEDGYFVQKSDFGVVAQDVQAVFPQAVRTRQDGTLAVDYEKLATLAFGAIKELAKRVEALEAK